MGADNVEQGWYGVFLIQVVVALFVVSDFVLLSKAVLALSLDSC
jgi:hypothetical protein